jgi:Eukaryotic protein of unknown function (DUF846)
MEPSSNAESQGTGGLQGLLKRSGHPIAIIFHFIFKIGAVICYLFLNLFLSDSTVVFIVILLLCCADFWTVQNITGRLLVALRWRNKVNEDGTEQWVFESLNEKHDNNPIDSYSFWLGLYAFVGVWALFLLANLLTLSPFGVISS